jgi:hypothetical protein
MLFGKGDVTQHRAPGITPILVTSGYCEEDGRDRNGGVRVRG